MIDWRAGMGRRSLRGKIRSAFVALAMLAVGLSAPSLAQTFGQAPQPAVRQSVDDNGVDVIRGSFAAPLTDLTIGPDAKSGLSFQRISGIGGVNTLIGVIEGGNGAYTVTLAGRSDGFMDLGGTLVSTEGNGATLLLAGGTYTYTSRDGTIARFVTNVGFAYPFYEGDIARLGSITYPDGSTTTFTQKVQTICPGGYDGNICQSTLQYVSRLQSATNNNGYQIKFTYASNTARVDPDNYAAWGTITAVTAINNAVEFCDPSADTCALANAWPTATFAGGTVTDALGRTNPATGKTTVAYDANGLVGSITRNGVTYSYTYADAGTVRTTTITDPNGGQRIYTSDTSTALLASFRDERGYTTSYAYDANGRLTQATYPEGNAVQYSYDARGNAIQTLSIAKPGSGLGNIVTSAVYPVDCPNPKTCNKPTSTTDARGQVTTYTYDETHGGVLTVTAPATAAGVQPQTRYSYTAYQAFYQTSPGAVAAGFPSIYKLTGVSSCRTAASCAGTPDETIASIGYGPQNGTPNNLLPVVVTQSAGDGSISATTAATYDTIGNVATSDGPLAGPADTTRLIYDAGRQLSGTIGPDPDSGGPLGPRAARYSYNVDGQATLVEAGTTASQSDAAWSAFTSLQQQTMIYDGNRRKVQTAVSAGGTTYAVTQASYDALGRVDCVAQRMNPDAFGALPGACALSTPGSFGSDRIARNGYDAASEQTSVVTGYGSADQRAEATATYTPNGKVATAADGKGNLTTYAYDGFDRLLRTSYPTAANGAASSATDFEELTYDVGSNVIQRRLRDGQLLSYTYDNLGRVVTKITPKLAYGEADVSYAYDNFGRLSVASYASGHFASFTYDALGRETAAGNVFGVITKLYDSGGRLTRLTWPDGFFVDYDHLVTGEMTAIRENGAASGVGVLASFTYDALGRRVIKDYGNGTQQSYSYDGASRLNGLNLLLANYAGNVLNFTFNPASQITSRTASNDAYAWNGAYNVARSYTSNGLNQYTASGAVTPTYDGRGNLNGAGGVGYAYTAENRLAAAGGQVQIYYDPLGRLLQVYGEANDTYERFSYDNGAIISELNNSNVITRRYVYGPGSDEPLVWYEGAGTSGRRFLHADERGSVVAASDSSGTLIGINAYDEFGIPQASNIGRFQYTGQAWLPQISMYHYKARIYSPTLGRFLQTDPIGYGDGLNAYNYVHGDPVNGADPSGTLLEFGRNAFVRPNDPNYLAEITVTGVRNSCSTSAFCNYSSDLRVIAAALEATSGTPNYSSDRAAGGGQRTSTGAEQTNKNCPTPPSPGPGRKALNKNIKRAELQAKARSSDFVLTATVANMIDLFNDVRPGAAQDYKSSASNNYIRGSQAFGNFNYGAVASARGISPWAILNAAKVVQVFEDLKNLRPPAFFDNPGDPEIIEDGIRYQSNGCAE